MVKGIEELKGQKFIGAVQLADEAARLIGRFVPRQERSCVSEVPDERMVRYYSTEGLISPPEGRQGASAVYGYRHLLELLVIKRLQAEHLPIRKIKELVENKGERELEQLLNAEEQGRRRERGGNPASEYLESLLSTASARLASLAPAVQSSSLSYSVAPASPTAWARVEIEPGLEVHIREDYELSDDAKQRQRLARTILGEIEKHGRRPRK
jgi:DNA-binding transcriptional MerR regulator